jgi:hypothetical protein
MVAVSALSGLAARIELWIIWAENPAAGIAKKDVSRTSVQAYLRIWGKPHRVKAELIAEWPFGNRENHQGFCRKLWGILAQLPVDSSGY